MSAFRYAIVGCGGQIAPLHINALSQLPDAEIIGMADVVAERGAARAAEVGVPFFSDHHTLLEKTRPDVVVICTPHPFHAPLTIDCLRAGAHVLVEKPIAVEVAEADAMIAAAQATGRVLAVNFQHRFDPAVEVMHDFITGGHLGALVRVECVEPWFRTDAYYRTAGWRSTWRGEGGGVLVNQAIHTLDLLCYLLGLPASVLAWARTLGHEVECEDTAQAMVAYGNGALGTLHVSTVEAGSPRRIHIVGDRASLELVGNALTITRFFPALSTYRRQSTEMFGKPATTSEQVVLPPPLAQDAGHLAVHRDLQQAITSSRTPRCDGPSGRLSLELANAIILSSCTQQAVQLPLDRAAYSNVLADLRAGKRVIVGAMRAAEWR